MKIAALPEMNFKDTELGPLPEEWRVVKFDKAFLRARRVPKVKRSDCQATGLVPVIDQSQSFIAGYVDDVTPYTGELPVIIFGDHTRAIKYVDFPFVAGADGTQVLLPNTQLFEPLFLYYALLKAEIPSRGYNRHFMILQEQMFPLPPLSEQRAIAHVLRTVQQAKQATERVIAALRDLKKSLMRHLFTYGPIPLGARQAVSQRETEIGPIPEHWQVVRLGEVAEVRGGVAFPPKYQGCLSGKYPFYKVSDMNSLDNLIVMKRANNWLDDHTARAIKAKPFPPGTIVFPKVGGALYTNKKRILGLEAFLDNNLMGVIVLSDEILKPISLYYLLETIDLRDLSNPGPLPSINVTRVKSVPIPLPPLSEQQEIARILQAVDRRIQAEEAYARALGELFRALLGELMSGRRRVTIVEEAADDAV